MTALHSTTVAALSTPSGSGIGVIRVSGAQALSIAAAVFRPLQHAKDITQMSGYTACLGKTFDADGDIDECILTVFRAPHSYTGEDVAELSCHGGAYLLSRTLQALFTAGARPAEPGEFTRRSFLNGKTDLTGAEAVMSLIGAQGRLAARTALAAREGAVFRQLSGVRASLLTLQAQFSAFVDYPDDDIPDLSYTNLEQTLTAALGTLQHLLDDYDAGKILRDGIDTVIVGAPNVGKSTLMNLLSRCERSIVTPVAGTTRDVVEETVLLGEIRLRLADTAGLHDTDDPVERIGIDKAYQRIRTAGLILAVLDASAPLQPQDCALLQSLERERTVVILNKSDLPCRITDLPDMPYVVPMSAADGVGVVELQRCVEQITGVCALTEETPLLAGERQRDCARRCRDALQQSLDTLYAGFTQDAVSVQIDEALCALLELTGERATDAVVGEIFSRFCVGK